MTRPLSSRRSAAIALTALVLTAACGLKPDATQSLKATNTNGSNGGNGVSGGGGANGTTGVTGGGGSNTNVPGVTGGTYNGGTGGTTGATGGTGTSAGGTGGGIGAGTGGGNVACGLPHGGNTTGITASTINIGLHAPLTGTGTPFPNNSFQAGAATFWKQTGHTVCGRKVNVEFQDDEYTPAHATQVCTAMAQRDFLVVGGGGTDQIQACAKTAAIQQNGVPYLSAGVTDNGLDGLSNYFAVSLTYRQQGTLVLRNAQAQGIATPADSTVASDNIPGAKAKWAIVTADTPNFAGARDGMKAALNAAHIPYKDFSSQVQQNGNYQGAATQFGQTLALDGFKTIYMDAAPGWFVFTVAGYYKQPTAQADWVGPGVTFTEVTVAQYICEQSQNEINGHAWFLAPAPGLDRATQDFKTAYGSSYDDIEWALWGLSNTLWNLLKDADDNLTRQNFISSTEAASVNAPPYAAVDFRDHGGHFGGTGAWVQKVNCSEQEPDQNTPGSWDTVGNAPMSLY